MPPILSVYFAVLICASFFSVNMPTLIKPLPITNFEIFSIRASTL